MLSFGASIPFVDHLGFRLMKMEGGESELHFEPRPEHLNSFDVVHGGATMTLLDVTLATAARSVTPDLGVVTIEMKTSFMLPARGKLVGKARLIHRTKSMAFTEGGVYDEEGRLCSHATGTFKYVPRRADPQHPETPAPVATD